MRRRLSVLLAAVLVLVAATAATGAPGFVREWRPDSGSGENALAGDGAGATVYLAQPGVGPSGRVVRFDRNGAVVRVLEQATGVDIEAPSGLAVDSAGLLYVYETNRARIAVVDPLGGVIRTITPAGADALDGFPGSLAVDAQDNLYVGDTRRSRVLVFGPGASGAAVPLRRTGPFGGGAFVSSIAVDAARNVYALVIFGTAGCEGRIEKHGPSGALLGEWSVTSDPTHICSRFIAVDPSTQDVLVSHPGGTQSGFRRYSGTGTPIGDPITGNGTPGDVLKGSGLAVANDGTIHVLDSAGHRILRFQEGFLAPSATPSGTPVTTPAAPTAPRPAAPRNPRVSVTVNLAVTIPSPQVVVAGPTSATAPGRISLGSLTRSRCIRVVVRSSRPARVLATIFSGRRSIRLFGQKEVFFRAPGRRVICIPVPRRARTFNVRTPLSFALGYRLGTIPQLERPARGPARTKPVITPIRLVP